MSLEKKLLKVIEAVERVPKKGYNAFNKYNYVMESDLLDYIRPMMVANGIIFGFDVEEIRIEPSGKGVIAYAKCKFTLIDADNPTEKIESTVWGSGYDTQDKGLYKAYTGATKYFLMKSNLISTGDDPERDNEDDMRKAFKVPAKNSQPREKKPESGKDEKIRNLSKAEQNKILPNIEKKINEIAKTEKEKEKIKQNVLIAEFGVDDVMDLTVTQARKFWDCLSEAV